MTIKITPELEAKFSKRSLDINTMAVKKLGEIIENYIERPDDEDDGFAPFFLDCAASIYCHAINHVIMAGENKDNVRRHIKTVAKMLDAVVEGTTASDADTKVAH